ncbi:MAG: PAS domain S-box protein [Magnetococcales bacterium]|nr:PAS domain S-box protein [Magnetococcales bacterium]
MNRDGTIELLGNRQVVLPLLLLCLVFIVSGSLISQRVERAIQSYQDAYLFLSANEIQEQFLRTAESYRNRLKVLAIRPEIGEGQFVIKVEGNSEPLGKLLRQEMRAAQAIHIRAVSNKGRLLFEQGRLDFDPMPLLADWVATIQAHPPIKDPHNQLDEVVYSRLLHVGGRFHLLTLAPLLDVEDVVGVIVLVHLLDNDLLIRWRDDSHASHFAGADPFEISLATRQQVVNATFAQGMALAFPAHFPEPFDQSIDGRIFRHVALPIDNTLFYLVLSSSSAIMGGLNQTIQWTLVAIFIVVLLLLSVILFYNARQLYLRQQAHQLQEQERRFRRLADAALEGIAFSEGSVLLDANLAFAEMFGYSVTDLTGRAILELVAPEQRAQVEARLSGPGAEPEALYEVLCQRQDQGTFLAEVRSRQIEYSGRMVRVTAIRDITQRKEAEQRLQEAKERAEQAYQTLQATQSQLVQAEKFASLGQLVAGVAHEISTPVGIGVTGASHLAQETQKIRQRFEAGTIRKLDFREYIELSGKTADLLLHNMERAAELIQSFKQVAVDRTSSERRSFDLRKYVDEILLSLHPRLKKCPHQLEVIGKEGVLVDSYPGAFAQIITNLVINALTHAFPPAEGEEVPRGGVLCIRLQGLPENRVQVTVSDNGQGIPEEHIGKIFDPFFTTKRGSGGSGLGLNISFNLAHQILGGRLGVTSQTGAGTTFTLTFPQTAPLAE